MPDKQAQLDWEARAGRSAAIAAFVSVLLIFISLGVQASIGQRTSKTAESLRIAHDHSAAITAYAILVGLSFLALIPVLLYLYRAAKFRRPEVPSVTGAVSVIGPVLAAIATVGAVFVTLGVADDFVKGVSHTEAHAKDLTQGGTLDVFRGLGLAGAIGTALALVLVGLHAMRSGLLSRFMGVLGIMSGVLSVIPLTPVPIVQLFWTGALGLLFLNRWPGEGRGPAWETGEATPWPTPQSRMAEQQGDKGDETEDPENREAAGEPEAEAAPNPRASRKKKKRKARR